jgi:hypothetical protein
MKTLRIVFFISMIAASALSQSVPLTHKNGLSVRSETVLSGIDMRHGTIDQAIAKLGKPSRVILPKRSYEWDKKTCWMRIIALDDGRIEKIDVRGTSPDSEIGATGRGLKLGASIADARHIYSPLHSRGNVPENADRIPVGPVALPPDHCRSAPTLEIDFDQQGDVDHMQLATSDSCAFD